MPDTTEDDQPRSVATSPAQPGWQRWTAPAALLVAVIAIVVAILAWTATPSAAESAKLAGDPKMRVCTAFDTVSKAVSLQTHENLGTDPVGLAAVAGNARLALLGGGQYLLSRLDSAAAPEPDLADAVRAFAYELQDIGMNALAGAANTDTAQADRLKNADLVRKHIVELCK
jgi:hypothetical protein